MLTQALLKNIHKFTLNNKQMLKDSIFAGCYQCKEIYNAKDVVDFPIVGETTAVCPGCSVDSVIGDKSGIPLTKTTLSQLNKYWFSPFK